MTCKDRVEALALEKNWNLKTKKGRVKALDYILDFDYHEEETFWDTLYLLRDEVVLAYEANFDPHEEDTAAEEYRMNQIRNIEGV